MQMCHRSAGMTATDDDGVLLVGSIVMDTNEVGFFAFKANSIDKAVKTHKVVVGNAVTFQERWTEQDPKAILTAVHECVANTDVDGQVKSSTTNTETRQLFFLCSFKTAIGPSTVCG